MSTPTTASTLSRVGAGFPNQALGSQAVFRAVLQALSHPGRSVAVPHGAQTPAVGHGASAAVLLALLDSDCTLWLSPRLAASDAGLWLRFHSGCRLLGEPHLAGFVWVAQGDALPALSSLAQGSDRYPDRSATCVVDVAFAGQVPAGHEACCTWSLTGPGIRDQATLQIHGLTHDFLFQWQANHAAFPCGVDLLFGTPGQPGQPGHIVGLPRSTRLTPCAG